MMRKITLNYNQVQRVNYVFQCYLETLFKFMLHYGEGPRQNLQQIFIKPN